MDINEIISKLHLMFLTLKDDDNIKKSKGEIEIISDTVEEALSFRNASKPILVSGANYKCPVCGESITFIHKFCYNCGKNIDWS